MAPLLLLLLAACLSLPPSLSQSTEWWGKADVGPGCVNGDKIYPGVPDDVQRLCPHPNEPETTLITNMHDCSSFFICTEGAASLMCCSPGLLWDPPMLVCDTPPHVDCGSRPILDYPPTTTTTTTTPTTTTTTTPTTTTTTPTTTTTTPTTTTTTPTTTTTTPTTTTTTPTTTTTTPTTTITTPTTTTTTPTTTTPTTTTTTPTTTTTTPTTTTTTTTTTPTTTPTTTTTTPTTTTTTPTTTTTTPTTTTTTPTTTTTTPTTTTTTPTTTTIPTTVAPKIDDKCKETPGYVGNLPMEEDCTQYYKCDGKHNGTTVSCLYDDTYGQMVYNPTTHECDYQWHYPCDDHIIHFFFPVLYSFS